ncbi:MAG: nicotinate (nicotinamide) nucleotide adenylyltransferase [Clostridiales bacterium]|nr:nicotinate (nicotinamide) nucleotide adenylyltransferase [Clostridiales bacterium]
MKIGLFGGTFSPPHNGHVHFAKLFMEKIGLDLLYVIPAGTPPHKETDPWGTEQARLDMARLAFGSFASISDYEIQQSGKSYTYKTLKYLQKMHPTDTLYLLVGEDMYLSFDTWKNPGIIFSAATVVCVSRSEGVKEKMKTAGVVYEKRYGGRSLYLSDEPLPISSTQIREMCVSGQDISHLVPATVAAYIMKHGLYKYE